MTAAIAAIAAAALIHAPGTASAAAPEPAAARSRQMSPLGLLPASFVNTGRPGARWQVDLLPGGVFQRRVSADPPPSSGGASTTASAAPVDEIGRYQIEGRRLTLASERDGPLAWDLLPDGGLRSATRPGLLLRRLAVAAPIEPRLNLTGLFTYFADAPRIVLCADGRSLPVAMAGDYLVLERAYSAARAAPGAPLWVQVDALIAPRPAMEPGQPPQATLVVERFGRVDAGGRCAGAVADRALAGTDWRVVATAGPTAGPTTGPTAAPTAGSPAAAPSNAPALRFDAGRVTGSDGCNRLMGPYAADGAALTLGPLAGTRMACAQGMAEAEAFRAALGRTATHRIVGDVLELQDAQGATLLRLQARP